MSGLSATVRARPDLIESAVVENKDGSITFHGYEPTRQQAAQFTAQGKLVPKGATVAAGPARPFSVTYDSSLPMQSKSLVYTASTNRTSMWAPEIEKGFAVALNDAARIKALRPSIDVTPQPGEGYANLNSMWAGDVLSILRGKQSSYVVPSEQSTDALWRGLVAASTAPW